MKAIKSYKDPIIIFGAARSGTSYLRRLLNTNSQIHLTYQSGIMKDGYKFYHEFQKSPNRTSFYKLLEKLDFLEPERKKNKALLDVISNYKIFLYQHYCHFRSYSHLIRKIYHLAYGVTYWGDKNLRVEYAWPLLNFFPNCKLLLLIRDPRAVVSSHKMRFNHTLIKAAGNWNIHFNHSMRLKNEYPDQVHLIQYENLVASPFDELWKILEFIDPSLTSATKEMLDEQTPTTHGLDKYKQTLKPKEIKLVEELCFSGMLKAGYSYQMAKNRRGISPWLYFLHNAWAFRRYLLRPLLLIRKSPILRIKAMIASSRTNMDKSFLKDNKQ